MNVYSKLQKCRVSLQNLDLKKTGENKFAGYNYFELGDFLPAINVMFDNEGLFGQVSFTTEVASLTIINTDKPEEQIVFTSPMSSASLKGCHDIQNVGAVETYQRRYLYTTALEIVESDALDGTNGKDAPQAPQKPYSAPSTQPVQTQPYTVQGTTTNAPKPISEGQIKLISTRKSIKKVPDPVYRQFLLSFGVDSTTSLASAQVNPLLSMLDSYTSAATEADDGLPF